MMRDVSTEFIANLTAAEVREMGDTPNDIASKMIQWNRKTYPDFKELTVLDHARLIAEVRQFAFSPLDQTVWVVEGGKIIETTPRQCSGYVTETTTPHGVGPVFYVDGSEVRRWKLDGRSEVVFQGRTASEAQERLDEINSYDFWDHSDIVAFKSRSAAEEYLKETQE